MNGMRVINIDSMFRKNYNSTLSTNVTIDLNYPIKNVISMKLSNIQLPNTWHNVSKIFGNNTIKVNGQRYILPDGNYNNQSIPKSLKNLYTTELPISQFGTSVSGYLASIDSSTGFSTIESKDAHSFELTILEDDSKSDLFHSLGWMLGFRKNKYSGGNKYISEGVFNADIYKYLYLVVDDKNYSGAELIIGNLKESSVVGNIIAIIRVNSSNYNIINTDMYETQTRIYANPVNIRKLSIKLLSPEGLIVNLNHMDIAFSLELEIKNDLLI